MRIAIFETEHFEGAYPVIKLFDSYENQVTIFTNADCYRQFEFLFHDRLPQFNWVIKQAGESKYQFIYRIYKEVKSRKIQLLYLNTINDNFIFYALMVSMLKNTRVILTLHDINTFFRHKYTFSLRRWVRIAGKMLLTSGIKEFNVVSLTMVDYLKKKVGDRKTVHCLPGAVFEDELFRNESGDLKEINIVVPGTIDERRRNYEEVFELLNKSRENALPVTVVILGGAYGDYGNEIIERCKAFVKTNNNLIFYEKKVVDQPEFDLKLNQAHFIFIPSVINTIISDDIAETYGKSKSSGNVFDIIKHAKPFIAPALLKVDPFLEASCIRYNKVDEIVKALIAIRDDHQKYARLQQLALEASGNYSIEAIRKRNPAIFSS